MNDRTNSILGTRTGPPVAWLGVFVGGLALAALISPLVLAAIKAITPESRLGLARVFNRCAMLTAIAFMIAFRRHMGWGALRALLTNGTRGSRAVEVVAGFTAALLAVCAGAGWALWTHHLGPTLNEYHFFAGRTLAALGAGLAAGFIEESFFRGLMLASLTASLGWVTATLSSSAIYSAVHLLSSDRSFVWHGYSVGAGFAYFQHAVARQLEPATLPPLFGLFIGGLVLALLVRSSGSLYLAIGIHAGWVFCFQFLRHSTRVLVEIPGSSYLATHHYLVGTRWAWTAMVLSGVVAFGWSRFARPRQVELERAAA
ncbi:MAG: CPBP family intramembrane metalloprotease [Acidobacteria bacterium]|nr:CPBP family intramembrane metalloprotease [Acidobacteriota bacterium]